WRRAYPPDVFETLFGKFDALFASGRVLASEEVLHELERNSEDDVCTWVKGHAGIFVPSETGIQRIVADVLANFPKLLDTRTNRSGADPWVIAVGEARGCAVVTHENATGSANRPNIPDVCQA